MKRVLVWFFGVLSLPWLATASPEPNRLGLCVEWLKLPVSGGRHQLAGYVTNVSGKDFQRVFLSFEVWRNKKCFRKVVTVKDSQDGSRRYFVTPCPDGDPLLIETTVQGYCGRRRNCP